MSQRTFTIIASVMFGVVALLQALRIFLGWPVEIGGWSVPMWFSWIAVAVAGFLSFTGLRLAADQRAS